VLSLPCLPPSKQSPPTRLHLTSTDSHHHPPLPCDITRSRLSSDLHQHRRLITNGILRLTATVFRMSVFPPRPLRPFPIMVVQTVILFHPHIPTVEVAATAATTVVRSTATNILVPTDLHPIHFAHAARVTDLG